MSNQHSGQNHAIYYYGLASNTSVQPKATKAYWENHLGIMEFIIRGVSVSCSVMPDSLLLHGLQPTRLLCPWDFPDKDTRVDCRFLLQGIFPTQGSNLGLPHCRQILYQLSYKGSTPSNQSEAQIMRQIEIMCYLTGCTRINTASLLCIAAESV